MDNLSEILVTTYPKTISLDDGTAVTLRPLLKADEANLVEILRQSAARGPPLPTRWRRRPKVIENWIYEMNYDTLVPLIALHDGHIVGDATLHFNPIGWTRHQAELRLTTSTQFPGQGAGNYPVAKPY